VIVLDTNVVSEALRAVPLPKVAAWLSAQEATSVFVTSITQAELLYGLAILPAGKRRNRLAEALRHIFESTFPGRILSFDSAAAGTYSQIRAERRGMGRPISDFDAMIAAIAKTRDFAIATRDEKGFAGCGVRIVNPWA
jgi:hypothetical protein